MKLDKDFYTRSDTCQIAKELLGKKIFTKIDGVVTSGIIVETESYTGINDKASHSYGGRRTKRNEQMYSIGGFAYIYLCYGLHHLFNVVTGKENDPQAVLIRAIEPIDGIDIMLKRRNKQKLDYTLTAGPGSLTQALGITVDLNGTDLNSDIIWIEDNGVNYKDIIESPRVGVGYAKEDALLPYRYRVKNNQWTSKAK